MSTFVAPPAALGTIRDDRRLRRRAAAAVLVLPATCLAVSRLVAPAIDATDTTATLDAIAAAPGRQTATLWLSVVALLTLVPAFLAAARLARRRRPVLAAVAAGVNLAAYLGAGLAFAAYDTLVTVAARQPAADRGAVVRLLDAYATSGVFNVSIGLFVIGHVVGAVLMGLALRGTLPGWAWGALAVSQPAHFVSFVILQNRVLDAASWGLTALGLAVCAAAVLRLPDGEWDLPPRG